MKPKKDDDLVTESLKDIHEFFGWIIGATPSSSDDEEDDEKGKCTCDDDDD